MLESAKSALDTVFIGYKGGEYLMTEETEVWIAYLGRTSDENLTPLAPYPNLRECA